MKMIKNNYLENIKFYDEGEKAKTKKAFFCGKTKVGKTYLASTFPNPFFIDTDGSLDGIVPEKRHVPALSLRVDKPEGQRWTLSVNGEITDFKPFEIIDTVLRNLRDSACKTKDKSGKPYEVKTIVIDGLTTLADMLIYEYMLDSQIGASSKSSDGGRNPLRQKPTYDEYGILEISLNILFTKIDDLGTNVVATAGLKADKDEITGKLTTLPDILGGFRHDVGHRFDWVCLLDKEGKTHKLYTTEKDRFVCGIRGYSGPDVIMNPSYGEIIRNIK